MLYRLSICIVVLFALLALWGECSHQYARLSHTLPVYNQVDASNRYQPPSLRLSGTPPRRHLLGTDNLGRDVLLRLVQGARIAFHVGIVTSLIAIPIGVILGMLGGYFGGKVDSLVNWICSTVASMPGLLFILAVSMVLGQGLLGVYFGIGLTTWVSVCRNIRAETARHRARPYVQAARVLGYSHPRILLRHILPNIFHIVLISFSIRFPQSVATEVFVSFLGIGAQNEPSWGIMINNARIRLWQGVWWEMTFVTLAIFLLVLSFNCIADTLRDRLDPALRNEQA